jgi:hypothetical protein
MLGADREHAVPPINADSALALLGICGKILLRKGEFVFFSKELKEMLSK